MLHELLVTRSFRNASITADSLAQIDTRRQFVHILVLMTWRYHDWCWGVAIRKYASPFDTSSRRQDAD